MAPGPRQRHTRWQQAGEWRREAVCPPGRHQRRGRRLPHPGSYTGTRPHSAIGYRDALPGVKIAHLRPCSPPSACPVRGVRGSFGTPQQVHRRVEEAIVAYRQEERARL